MKLANFAKENNMNNENDRRPPQKMQGRDDYKRRGGRFMDAADDGETSEPTGFIEGKNAVMEALCAGREIDKILFAAGSNTSNGHIIAKARQMGIITQETDRRKIDQMSTTGAHQGIIALAAAVAYSTIEQVFELAQRRGEKPLLVLCDEITDPHNLGAIIRSAEVAGAHGVFIPKRRSAGLNAACAKAAAGALEHIPVVKCQSMQTIITELKKLGVFIYAADMTGTEMYKVDFTGAVALVIGSEGSGVSKLARENSDVIVSIPQKGNINSLNASNAAAVLLYEVYRQRI